MTETEYDFVCRHVIDMAIFCCGEPLTDISRDNVRFNCPFCESEKLAFSQTKSVGHCFRCSWSGNAISLIKDVHNLDTHKAIKLGLSELKRYIDSGALIKTVKPTPVKKVSKEIQKVSSSVKSIVYSQIYSYLRSKNKEEEQQIRKTFLEPGLPEFVNSYIDIVISNKYDAIVDRMKKLWGSAVLENVPGFFTRPDGTLVFNLNSHILIPYRDPETYDIVAFNGRRLSEWGPKYMWVIREPKHYYFPMTVDYGNVVMFTEGEKKAIAATAMGVPTVALAGIECYNTEESKKEFLNKELFICFDNERFNPNVLKAQNKMARLLHNKGHSVFFVNLPVGRKLDDFLVMYGVDELKRLMGEAIPYESTR